MDQKTDPTPLEIQAMCARIRAGWDRRRLDTNEMCEGVEVQTVGTGEAKMRG